MVALVTGGSTGIGLATAQAFAREGAKVVIAARRLTEGAEAVASIVAEGGEAFFVETDVADESSVRRMVEACAAKYGGLDVAYNNAGIVGVTTKDIVDTDSENFDQVMAINARGVWLSMKYEIEAMLKRGGGAVVNCSSTGGVSGGMGRASAYYASKHAVIGMTKQVAAEFATRNIRVNAVLPGVTTTTLLDSFRDDPAKLTTLASQIPMQRMGEPSEIARAVLWLCANESSYVTGISLPADGGVLI
jgi:NAD(P)-dependent dehydrogenase (short-subunit alcohol dehydrogenase family)